jgi:hypothetical protein
MENLAKAIVDSAYLFGQLLDKWANNQANVVTTNQIPVGGYCILDIRKSRDLCRPAQHPNRRLDEIEPPGEHFSRRYPAPLCALTVTDCRPGPSSSEPEISFEKLL